MAKTERVGIVLSGGKATRLYPSSLVVSKQLMPLYSKPVIFYSLSLLMLTGIRKILLISTPKDLHLYKELFDFINLGIDLSFTEQTYPRGLADAFLVGESFIGKNSVSLVLGDNILFGYELHHRLKKINHEEFGATIFGYPVLNPSDYGVVELDNKREPLGIEEKPNNPKTNLAVIGFYFYDNDVVQYAKTLKPSRRGELEITDIHNIYLKNKNLKVEVLGRGIAWFDMGQPNQFLQAANFIQTIEERTGLKIGCLEEISYNNGWIGKRELEENIKKLGKNDYSDYLRKILDEK